MVADWRIDGGLAESATLHNPRAATVLLGSSCANQRMADCCCYTYPRAPSNILDWLRVPTVYLTLDSLARLIHTACNRDSELTDKGQYRLQVDGL